MPSHEYFQELSALASIAQLSSDENRELNDHLSDCASCREVHEGYAQVIQSKLPQADAIRWRIKNAIPNTGPDHEIRDRFLARARAEGLELSSGVDRIESRRFSSPWRKQWREVFAMAATAALIVVVLISSAAYKYRLVSRSGAATSSGTLALSGELLSERDSLREQLVNLLRTMDAQSETAKQMKQDNLTLEESLQKVQKQLDESRRQQEQLSAHLRQIDSERANLAAESQKLASANQRKDETISDLQTQNDKLSRERSDILGSRAILEGQVRDLNESLQHKTEDVDRERQLMAATNDVRQLMGARNLHIIDVHDVGGSGKVAKAFGRVFYASGQSLVFYAFDLPNGGLTPAKYSFQAWGQREDGVQIVRNLGAFKVEDHEQRRWVLKVNDPTLLAGIDSVFVTSEALGDSREPHGKKLMYAYIVGQPNHP